MTDTPGRPALGLVKEPRAKRLTLGSVSQGVRVRPLRVVLAGVEGVGKSTFAAGTPSPIFLGSEDGTGHLDVTRFPEATTWGDIFDAIDDLATQPHEYKTLVIDTIDWLEPLCWAYVCQQSKKYRHIEDFGYGKGYLLAVDLGWRPLTQALDALRAKRGMQIILLAHATVRRCAPPGLEPYDRYSLKMQERASAYLREWADCVLFARHEVFTHKQDARVRAFSTGARVLHTQWSAAYDAKNRCGLPETIPLAWEDFWAAVQAGAPAAAAEAAEQIHALLPQLAPAHRAMAEAELVKRAGDPLALAKLLDRCRVRASEGPAANP